jgi:hypothetical protein
VEMTMDKRKRITGQITIYKTLHRKLKIEQLNVTFATNINEICFNIHYWVRSFLYRKIGRSCEQPGFTEKQWIPGNASPIGTSLPSDNKRGFSIVSLEWKDNSRANTPFDLFTAKSYNWHFARKTYIRNHCRWHVFILCQK